MDCPIEPWGIKACALERLTEKVGQVAAWIQSGNECFCLVWAGSLDRPPRSSNLRRQPEKLLIEDPGRRVPMATMKGLKRVSSREAVDLLAVQNAALTKGTRSSYTAPPHSIALRALSTRCAPASEAQSDSGLSSPSTTFGSVSQAAATTSSLKTSAARIRT